MNIQHFKTRNFSTFSIFVGHFCPPGSTDLIESGSDTDPDPKRNLKLRQYNHTDSGPTEIVQLQTQTVFFHCLVVLHLYIERKKYRCVLDIANGLP